MSIYQQIIQAIQIKQSIIFPSQEISKGNNLIAVVHDTVVSSAVTQTIVGRPGFRPLSALPPPAPLLRQRVPRRTGRWAPPPPAPGDIGHSSRLPTS